ncbi:MAG: hypothetical protein ABI947_23890 [Chloroflexota bacterium]
MVLERSLLVLIDTQLIKQGDQIQRWLFGRFPKSAIGIDDRQLCATVFPTKPANAASNGLLTWSFTWTGLLPSVTNAIGGASALRAAIANSVKSAPVPALVTRSALLHVPCFGTWACPLAPTPFSASALYCLSTSCY